jgi:ABC-type branched-subunit amino acid transport system ATPase component
MLLDGQDSGAWPSFRARGGIGYVPQGREIVTGLSAGENLLIAANTRRPIADASVLPDQRLESPAGLVGSV